MPDEKRNLYVYEAIELRSEYDRHIKLLRDILTEKSQQRERFIRYSDDEQKVPASDFDRELVSKTLKSLQTKRIKLNQAIQVANFEHQVPFEGESVSLAEALEIRKNLKSDLNMFSERVSDSAYDKLIHKEDRDIVSKSEFSFSRSYEEYKKALKQFRVLISEIHKVNHEESVAFQSES